MDVVSVGDTVDLGQPIAEAGGFVSAPVHATVSGKVKAIEPRLHPNGSKVLSIVIENDGEDRGGKQRQIPKQHRHAVLPAGNDLFLHDTSLHKSI